MDARTEVDKAGREVKVVEIIFGAEVESESEIFGSAVVVEIIVGVDTDAAATLHMIVDIGDDSAVDVVDGIGADVGLVGIDVGHTVEDIDVGTDGEGNLIELVAAADREARIGVDESQIASDEVGGILLTDPRMLVHIGEDSNSIGRDRETGLDSHLAGKIDEDVAEIDTKAQEVEVDIATDLIVARADFLSQVGKVEDRMLRNRVGLEIEVVERNRKTGRNIKLWEREVEGAVLHIKGRVIIVALRQIDGVIHDVVADEFMLSLRLRDDKQRRENRENI